MEWLVLMYKVRVTMIVIVLCLLQSYYAMVTASICYECPNVASPELCTHIRQCGHNEECFVQSHHTSSSALSHYSMGCRDRASCTHTSFSKRFLSLTSSSHSGSLSSSSSLGSTSHCHSCCTEDFCNRRLCDTDVSSMHCMGCTNMVDPSQCDQVMECGRDHMCYVQSKGSHGYNQGCMPELQCNALMSLSVHYGCTKCCNNNDNCNLHLCSTNNKVDGGWSNWGGYSECSVTTGHGTSTRYRTCDNPKPQYGGEPCHGGAISSNACTVSNWSSWSSWSHCSATCSTGIRYRGRHCVGGSDCVGDIMKTESCTVQACAHLIDGAWGHWGDYSQCSVTKGTGARERFRQCDRPAPQNGGAKCSGQSFEVDICKVAVWGPWSSWSPCSVTCGSGVRYKGRVCETGSDCLGTGTDLETCHVADCIEGGWGAWSHVSCSVTCGVGYTTRTRLCDSPVPSGGHDCVGSFFDKSQQCNAGECPIDGGWSDYKNLSCSVTCGVGVKVSIRECNSPAPLHGGNDCVGYKSKFDICNPGTCDPVSTWTEWSSVNTCTAICGEGHIRRTRTCNGRNCTGSDVNVMDCNNGACPPDIKLCDHKRISSAVTNGGTLYTPTSPTSVSTVCPDPRYHMSSAMLKHVCNATVDNDTWNLTVKVKESCGILPLYVPIGYIDHVTYEKSYGILMDCYQDTLQIATQSCDRGAHVRSVKLLQSPHVYHMVTW